MGTHKTHYEILEVRDNASPEVIKMAYKALCLKYHPDTTRLGTDESYLHMQKINAAYEVLSNKDKRLFYDSQLGYSYKKSQSNWSDTAAQDAARAESRRKQEDAARAEARKRQAEAVRAEEKRRQEEAEARARKLKNVTKKINMAILRIRDVIQKIIHTRVILFPILFGVLILIASTVGFKIYENQAFKNDPTYYLENVKVGQVIKYGYFEQNGNTSTGKEPIEWFVFDIDEQREATLVSTKILHYKTFAASNIGTTTWNQTFVKYWLEEDFANSLTALEKAAIVSYKIPNVTDVEELYKMGWSCNESKYASQREMGKNIYRKNYWWVTPNSGGKYESNITVVNESGHVEYDGLLKTDLAGIVPVLIIQLD